MSNCPSCGKSVRDGVSICPHCDHIIDDSFLYESSPPAPSRPREAKSKVPAPRTAGRAAPASAASARGSASPARDARRTARRADDDEEERSGGRAAERERERWESGFSSDAPEAAADDDEGGLGAPGDDALEEVKSYFASLNGPDKLVFVSLVLTTLTCFLPWRETPESEALGLMGLGLPVLGGAALLFALLIMRNRGVDRGGSFAPRAQLLIAAASVLWCLVALKLAWDDRLVPAPTGNLPMGVPASRPGLGAVFALATTLLTVVGSLLGWRDKTR